MIMLIWYFIVDERVFIVENLNDSSIRIDLKKGEEKMGNFYTSRRWIFYVSKYEPLRIFSLF